MLEVKAVCPMEKDSKEVTPIMGISREKEQQSGDNVATELHQLIKQYNHLFQEPTELSPKRNYWEIIQ
jgi:hypothetical protein